MDGRLQQSAASAEIIKAVEQFKVGAGQVLPFAVATDGLPETPEAAAMPDLQGYGNVRDLHHDMLHDTFKKFSDTLRLNGGIFA